ncbi:MAG: hypothetical protein DMG32_17940 [Acidobacteria bacterium]|nr:MAG: hypothetical protein DMG32_17940 [Acidobacteriota bacterium]
MKAGAVYNDAFRVCHEIYVAARERVNSRVPTTQMQSASKFLWRPDLRPRLVEYVADFARAGERALGKTSLGRNNAVMSTAFLGSTTPRLRGRADRIEKRVPAHAAFGAKKVPRASRLILFRLYYPGGAEYEAARHLLGLSERTWSDWAEEIRERVGAELIRAHMYPPARYFRQASAPAAEAASTKEAPEAKIKEVPHELDFA